MRRHQQRKAVQFSRELDKLLQYAKRLDVTTFAAYDAAEELDAKFPAKRKRAYEAMLRFYE